MRLAKVVCLPVFAGALTLAVLPPARSDEQKLMSLGRQLAPECTSCHKLDGADAGIPSITGWRKKEFVETMAFYQKGERKHQAMNSVAQSLDDRQLEALAVYFGSLPKPARRTADPAPPKKP